ncbi:MAG: SGNH/GDSL hydrolase family protein [Prolixibacteraceae bacterium]
MKDLSRRTFLKKVSLSSATLACLPVIKSVASTGELFSKRHLKGGVVILFQGDSITDGNWGRNNDPNHRMGHGYAFSIASRVGADYPEKDYHFYNRGISGNKVIDLEKRWQTDTIDLKPDVLSILVGVNDAASVVTHWEPEVPLGTFDEIYDSLLAQIMLLFPDVLLVLGEPFIAKGSRTIDNWDAYQTDVQQRQNIVRKLAQKYNAVFVGYQEVFDQAFEKASVEYWIWDGVHPTVAGHELMAREWLKQVGKRIVF